MKEKSEALKTLASLFCAARFLVLHPLSNLKAVVQLNPMRGGLDFPGVHARLEQ